MTVNGADLKYGQRRNTKKSIVVLDHYEVLFHYDYTDSVEQL